MQLDEFVKTTLMQVIKGVSDAQKEAEVMGAIVNPRPNEGSGERRETDISFDVALTVTDITADEFGGKLSVVPIINLGGKATESESRQEISRVQFNVSMALPCNEERKLPQISQAAKERSRRTRS